MRIDLHTHSTASDGLLTPNELLDKAAAAGVEMLACTDHDTLAGIRSIIDSAPSGLRLITGVELSATWRKIGVHILGLNIDLDNAVLNAGIARQTIARDQRAIIIAERLEKLGFRGTLEGAQRIAGGGNVGRPHFARYLTESGQIKDEKEAFKRYLGRGKACDIKNVWATLEEVVQWILSAGGTASLAHPAKYKLSNLKLEELIREFAAAGGQAIEVISGQQEVRITQKLASLASRHNLSASAGSDFHNPDHPWSALGTVAPLPDNCRPVWEGW
jgi:predicted metal-dependent phosphoesterase TrpH